jgi:DNA-binding XRE family transcriptional regulator
MIDHTGPRNGTSIAYAVTFTVLFGVGTGGDYTPNYHSARNEKELYSKSRPASFAKTSGFAISADIERIKAVLNLTMTELARCIGVSRQAPYNWVAGGAIKENNFTKLSELRSAADTLVAENLELHPRLLHRKLPGGRTLLETVAGGGSGAEAARALANMLKIESDQRAALAKMFAGRESVKTLGMPALNDG